MDECDLPTKHSFCTTEANNTQSELLKRLNVKQHGSWMHKVKVTQNQACALFAQSQMTSLTENISCIVLNISIVRGPFVFCFKR